MSNRCPTCQTENNADSRFCFRCGSALPAHAGAAPTEVLGRDAAPPMPGGEFAPISGAAVAPPVWGSPGPRTPPPQPYSQPYPLAPATLPPATPRRTTSPLALGCIGVGAFMLLLAAVLVVVAVIAPAGAFRGASRAAPTAAAGEVGTSLDSAIRAAVDASNRAQIEAMHTVDASPLKGVVIGQALDNNLQILMNLQRRGSYAVSTLEHIEYQPAKQLDADHASIRTTESWTTLYYLQGTTQLTGRQQSAGLQEIYYLVRQNGAWIVEQIDINAPTTTPAPNDTQ